MTADQIMDALDRFGVAIVILGFVFVCIWKVGKWVAKWIEKPDGPVQRVVESHVEFVKSARILGEEQVGLQKRSAEMHAQHFTQSDKACSAVKNVREAGGAACDVLEQLSEHYQWPDRIKSSVAEVRRLLERE